MHTAIPFQLGVQSPPQSDSDLLAAVAEGDEDAFSLLYDRFSTVVFSLVYRIVQSRAEAEDILQKAFWRIWEHAPHYTPQGASPLAWIATIARRISIDHIRASARHQARSKRAHELGAPLIDHGNVHALDSLTWAEKAQAVRRELAELEPREREAIELAFFDGLTHEEIARLTETPLGTVKARIRRGMQKLQQPLADLRSGVTH